MAELTEKKLEKLLSDQTSTILDAVDFRLGNFEKKIDKKMDVLDKRMDLIDKRMDHMERKIDDMRVEFNEKIDRLTNVIDEFVGLYKKHEQELLFMKKDLDKIKFALKDKLDIDIGEMEVV